MSFKFEICVECVEGFSCNVVVYGSWLRGLKLKELVKCLIIKCFRVNSYFYFLLLKLKIKS